MEFHPTELPGVLVIEPDVHRDERGFFLETHQEQRYREGGVDARFVQDNHSRSVRNTVRGLHGQRHHPQGKLVRVTQGEVFDVAVDVRTGSPTFGVWAAAMLTAENFRQLWIPAGYAHGFCVVSETADLVYKCTAYYDPDDEFTVRWNDPDIGIPWPVEQPLLSTRDAGAPALKDAGEILPTYP